MGDRDYVDVEVNDHAEVGVYDGERVFIASYKEVNATSEELPSTIYCVMAQDVESGEVRTLKLIPVQFYNNLDDIVLAIRETFSSSSPKEAAHRLFQ